MDGDIFDAGVTGREAHFVQENADSLFATTGLPGAVLESELRRELFSPSGNVPFFLKLKARNKPPDSGLPLEEP